MPKAVSATDIFVRRVGRPRNEWAKMLRKECVKMGIDIDGTLYIEGEWRVAVYQHRT